MAVIPWRRDGSRNRKGYKSPTCEDRSQAVARDVGGGLRERRKEVALGRLRTVSLILILGAWGGATRGAAPDDAAAAPSTATRQAPPAPPIKYLEAGAKLYNNAQFDLASRYLEAANRYRDQLQSDERVMLDAYLKELAKVKQGAGPVPSGVSLPAATPVTAVAPAVTAVAPAVQTSAPPTSASAASVMHGLSPAEAKQKGVWLLKEGREQLLRGNYEAAQAKVDAVRSLDIQWGLFDDTPDKLQGEITKARPKSLANAPTSDADLTHDRRTAKVRLREARAMLNNRQYEQAEAVALEVKQWGISYGLFDETPDKVAAAARALRRREQMRHLSPREQSSQGVYRELVHESRQYLAAGRLDEAENKARIASRMGVVPGLDADRAETVLHEIAMIRQQNRPAVAPPAPANGAAASQTGVALAHTNPSGVAADTAVPATDPSVQRISAGEGNAGPELAAPAETAAAAPPADQGAGAAPTVSGLEPVQAAAAPAPLDAQSTPASPPGNRGEQLLAEAKALYTNANYSAALQLANEAKAGKFGVDAQAGELIAQINMAAQAKALSLYEEALASLRRGDNQRARNLLTEVAADESFDDENLKDKVQGLLQKLSSDKGGSAAASPNDAAQDADALAAQQLNAEVGTKIAEARRYHEIDPDKAIGIYEKTLQAVQGAALPPELTRPMVRRLEVSLELARKDKAQYLVKMVDKKQREEIELKRLRILEADKAKKIRMQDLMDKATAAYAEGKYVECETYAKKAMEIDPNELAASMLAFKAKMERRYKTDKQILADKEDGVVRTLQEVDLASVSDPEVQINGIKYAKNFKDLTRERLAMNARLQPRKDPKVLAIEAKLREPISINVDKQSLSEAVKFIQDYTGLNIVIDPKGVSDEGLTSGAPVSLSLNNVQVKTALKLMLRPLGLTYKVDDEVVVITSPQATQQETFVKTYYVGDLMIPPPKGAQNLMPHNVIDPELMRDLNPTGTMVSNLGNTTTVNPGNGPMTGGVGTSKADRRWVDMTPIVQLIASSIAPGTWQVHDGTGADVTQSYGLGGAFGGGDAGGLDVTRPIGAITPFFLSISLIIRHTAEVHDQVADLLRQLRRLQDLQVSIEVRFITVQDNFFEQIGVDFDFQIQSDSVGKHSTFATINPTTSLFPVPGVTGGILTGTSTSSSTSTGGGTTAGGTTTGGSSGGLSGGSSGGSSGGLSGGSSGGLGGGSSGGLSGGSSGGLSGGSSGGLSGGSSGGSSTGSSSQPVYIVNPVRDHALGNNTPIIVGTQGGGLGNFSPNLDIPFVNTSASLIAPTYVNNYQSTGGATFGIAFLSDLEVYLFLTAAQGDTRSNVLQAPKVTTFNGAAATVFSNTVQYYVSNITPIIGPAAVAYQPNVSALPIGVTLNVTPVVSADRRYVRLTMSPFFQALNGFTTYQSGLAAVGGIGFAGGGGTISSTIQLPNTTTNTVTTTVTVPDGGTVLLGGVKSLTEQRVEYGVPVLSKTPLIDRLFRNVGIGRNSQSLMLMVTPRIIILEEEEERLGIPSVAL